MELGEYGYEDLSLIVNEGQGRQSVSRWQANSLYVVSFLIMSGIRVILNMYGKPTFVKPNVEFWKLRNIFISFIHALTVGIWANICILWYPDMSEDPVFYLNNSIYLLVPFSMGYFTYDLADIVTAKKCKENWETVIHHVIVIVGMGISWNVKILLVCDVMLLSAEMNSIFLHLRKLLQFSNFRFDSLTYKVVAGLNLLTFVIFRFIPFYRVYAVLINDAHRIPKPFLAFILTGYLPGVLVNIGLFYVVFRSDVLRPFVGFGRKKRVNRSKSWECLSLNHNAGRPMK